MQLVNRVGHSFPYLVESLFDRSLHTPFFQKNYEDNVSTAPLVNVYETKDEYIIDLAVPGIKKNDVRLHIENDVLEVFYDTKKDEAEKKGKYTHREFSFYSFSKSFTLPKGKVNTDDVQATYEKGILTVSLPKREEAKPKPKRVIEVS